MPRKIFAAKTQFVNTNTTKTLHATRGKIFAILATNEAAATDIGSITLYDSTVVPGAALAKFALNISSPLAIFMPQNTPLIFETALTVVTSANCRAFLITEAEG